MAEYIEREALKKQMNATCRNCDARFDERECGRCGMEWAKEIVRAIPAADVAPVVRCKDCVHRVELFKPEVENGGGVCMKLYDTGEIAGYKCRVKADDFCSYGERRDTP